MSCEDLSVKEVSLYSIDGGNVGAMNLECPSSATSSINSSLMGVFLEGAIQCLFLPQCELHVLFINADAVNWCE